jgi:hypothetical protein
MKPKEVVTIAIKQAMNSLLSCISGTPLDECVSTFMFKLMFSS